MNEPTKPELAVITFGKHKGRTLGWIAENDVMYLDWLQDASCVRNDPVLACSVAAMCRRYREEIAERLGGDD